MFRVLIKVELNLVKELGGSWTNSVSLKCKYAIKAEIVVHIA